MTLSEKLPEALKSGWLELLKASGWKTAAIAFACGAFLLFARAGWTPPLAPWITLLAVASFAEAAFKFFPVHVWIVHSITVRREKRNLRDYIPHMTPRERKIISYLLAKNQKMFTAATDGGYATTLISRRIVVRALQPGQVFGYQDMPLAIPDHLWEVLLKHKKLVGEIMLQTYAQVDAVRKHVARRISPRRKSELGQFMTPATVACFMASLFSRQTL